MILRLLLWTAFMAGEIAIAGAGLAPDSPFLWPKGIIPYSIEPKGFTDAQTNTILAGIEQLNRALPVRIISRKAQRDYVLISPCAKTATPGLKGSATIGRAGGAQPLLLCEGFTTRTVFHEFGHTMGFIHEHQRWDRDEVVLVNQLEEGTASKESFTTNIGDVVPQMDGEREYKLYTPYDPHSIMHYTSGYYDNVGSLRWFGTADDVEQSLKSSRRFSLSDIDAARQMYFQRLSNWPLYPYFVCGALKRPTEAIRGVHLELTSTMNSVRPKLHVLLKLINRDSYAAISAAPKDATWCAWGPKLHWKDWGTYYLWAENASPAAKAREQLSVANEWKLNPIVPKPGSYTYGPKKCTYEVSLSASARSKAAYAISVMSTYPEGNECGNKFEYIADCLQEFPTDPSSFPATFCYGQHDSKAKGEYWVVHEPKLLAFYQADGDKFHFRLQEKEK